ncbi:hypothetical protein GCM10011519_08240 [Marmoricola endophyticus]|uniref:Barstar (barnase inhibitor) domain-containing protein n=1 Tax=Marmoricola endophyticus TaxID=2040280 RepID=A0A917F034_9ACTN|nr:barstar family protein [Marmoricola endophyticus]GGF37095.1 hypothetical protein GCM10011519_08240 [Marmoricola endophyticus]
MTESIEEIDARVAAGTRQLLSKLERDEWCTVAVLTKELDWNYVLRSTGRVVRKLRGRKMRAWPALMDEFGAALQFGDYFGENYPALDECLCDLDWLPTDKGYVLIIVNPEQVLTDDEDNHESPDAERSALVQLLQTAVDTYAEPIELGEYWDRPAVPFDVILVTDAEHRDEVVRRWKAAGAPLED